MTLSPFEQTSDMVLSLEKQNSDERVSIIVIHKDKPEYLNACLQTIAICSVNNDYELIVVDNGSTSQDAIDFLDDLENNSECDKVIRNKENLWWSKAANQGAKAADKNSKYFIFLHSDVLITNRAWIDLLINISESEDAGLVGLSMQNYAMDNKKQDFIEEWCMMTTRECYEDCGPFVEELPQIGAPFIFNMACYYAGHKLRVLKTPIAHHYAIFGVDINDFATFRRAAKTDIYKHWSKVPSRVKKRDRKDQK